jgi:protein gp37
MADVFDEEVSDDWRRELFTMIELTQWLDWQILTKRPHLIEAQLRRIGYWDKLPLHNVWFGTTMEDQASFNLRWPELRRIPAKVRFCSYEPALGALEIPEDARGNLHWLIAGGETTPVRNHSRPSDPKWFRGVRDQCDEMGIAFFFKQWGNDLMMEDGTREWHGKTSGDYARLHSLLDDRRHLEFPQIPERVLPITCVGGNAV